MCECIWMDISNKRSMQGWICANKKHHSSSLSVFYQRFVVSRRIHVWIIYLHMFNCHGKEIPYVDRVAIDMWFLFQSTSHFPIGIQAVGFAKGLA